MTSKFHKYKFLVDVNLHKLFKFFNAENFVHVVDIDPQKTDKDIITLALEEEFVILTKDSDFYNQFMTSSIFPKTVYFQLGNMTLKELHQYFENNWLKIIQLLDKAAMIIAYPTYLKEII